MHDARGIPVDHLGKAESAALPIQVIEILQHISGKIDDLAREVAGKAKSHLTVEEVAELTGRSPYTVRRWITSGVIVATRVTAGGPRGRLLVAKSELAKLVGDGKGNYLD